MSNILSVKKLNKSFGKLCVTSDLSFEVEKGEILGLMGPNGAGKTTLFNLISGVLPPDTGEIRFGDEDITKTPSFKRCRKGIGRTYQIPQPFEKLSVYENMLVSAVHGGGLSEKKARDSIDGIIEEVGLSELRDQLAGKLSLLKRKSLELGRALASEPKLILLDEIAGGLTEAESQEVITIVQKINKKGISIIWIEHLMAVMNEGVDRLLVIAEGRYLNCGDPKTVMNSKCVLERYLGEED